MTDRHRTQGAVALERAKMVLTFTHVPTGKKVEFPAYLEMFSDAYNSNWNSEDVYGRMDPIATFSNTRRALSVSWNIPSESYEHAQENLSKANKILSFLYPLYDSKGAGGATAINQGPLMRVSFGNLIRDAKTGSGLLGYVNGFTFDPDLDLGMFVGKPFLHKETAGIKKANNLVGFDVEYYPKAYRLNFEFTVLHEHPLGFRMDSSGQFVFGDNKTKLGDMNFPYGVTSTPKTAGATEDRLEQEAAAELEEFVAEAQRLAQVAAGRVSNAISQASNALGLGGDN